MENKAPKNKVLIKAGDIVQIVDRKIEQRKDGKHTMHFDILSPGGVQYVRVIVENAEEMLNEHYVRIKEIVWVMQKGIYIQGHAYSRTNHTGVILERTNSRTPDLIGRLRSFEQWKKEHPEQVKKPEAKPIEKPSYASEKVPKTAPIPSAKKITGQTTGFGLDSFLDALHDEDLSGVRECEDELPFN